MNVAELLARSAARAPGAVAIYEDDGCYATYCGLLARALRIASWLRGRAGLEPGSRVALVGRNSPAYIESLFGAWCAGMIVVPVNHRLHPAEVATILEDSGAGLCLCELDMQEALTARCAASGIATRILAWEELAAAAAGQPGSGVHAAAPGDLAWLFYTSGTTGRPKGVMLTHENLRQMVLNFFADVMQPSVGSTLAHIAPLSHGSGMYLLAFVAAGAANLVPTATGMRTGELIALLNRHRRIAMFAAPTMVRRIAEASELGSLELERIELIVYGGGPMLLADIEAAVERLGPRLAQIYGQGESPMTITRLPRQDIERSAGGRDPQALASVGRAFTGVELRVLDPRGRQVAPDEIGEVAVRGPTVMRGYWRQEAATAAQIRDGWLWTGDLGSLDSRGYLTLKDRSRDVVISGGMNIYPREVEEALAQHPRIAEVAVIGGPDPEWGERVVAFVVARTGQSVPTCDLDAHCRARIAAFKRPREYRFVAELPRNDYGKVLKRELRKRLQAERDGAAAGAPLR